MNAIIKNYKVLLLAIAIILCTQSGNTQDCYLTVMDHIGATNYINDLQEDAACRLKDSINDYMVKNDFSPLEFNVLGYNLYPILGAVDEEFGLETAFEAVEANLIGKSDYLAIVKYISSKDNDPYSLVEEKVLKYKVYVDVSNLNDLGELSTLELDALVTHLQSFLVAQYNAKNNPVGAEISTINELWNYLKKPQNLDDLLLSLEFLKIEVPSSEEFIIGRNSDDLVHTEIDAYDNVYNYGGYVLNGQTLEETLLTDAPGDLSTLTASYYLSGKEVSDTPGEFEAFYEQFSTDPAKVKLFIYFNFETEAISTLTKDGGSESRNGDEPRYCYYKVDNNLSKSESEDVLDSEYENIHSENTDIASDAELSGDCSPSWQFGRKCLYQNIKDNLDFYGIDESLIGDQISRQAAMAAGFVDGFLGTIQFLMLGTNLIRNCIFDVVVEGVNFVSLNPNNKVTLALACAFDSILKGEENNPWEVLKDIASEVVKLSPLNLAVNLLYKFGNVVLEFVKKEISNKFDGSAADFIAYQFGVVAFDAVLTGVTGGAYLGAKVIARGSQVALKVGKSVKNIDGALTAFFKKLSPKMRDSAGGRGKAAYCAIGSGGCFVKDTPVLVANSSCKFSLKNSSKKIAVAAAIPFIAVPIQEVQLLDYVVAHETVNSTYGLITSTNDTYLGLLDKDPYTSDEQRERDQFKIDDENWNEVVFEEVNGNSVAQLALHNDWINQKDYQVDVIVNMNLPEQGISGPFRITSIKHILPQKKPGDEDGEDAYVYRPVTALFAHTSNQVFNLSFDNGEVLGVTYQHPIYSLTDGDWELAGKLEIGEEVLTKSGVATVVGSKKKEGTERVYNLEVKEMHNFLVGDDGIVVHNNCVNTLYNLHNSMFKNVDDVIHIMRGNVKRGRAGGVHHKSAVSQGEAREIGARIQSSDGLLYKVKVEVKDANGNFIAKKSNGGYSTFFPDSWDQMRVLDEIKHARNNKKFVSGNEYWGYSKDGKIKIHMYLRNDGTIISAYPKF